MFIEEPLDQGAFQAGAESAVNREAVAGNFGAAFKIKNAQAFAEGFVIDGLKIPIFGVEIKGNRPVFFDHVVARVFAFRSLGGDVRNVHQHFCLLVIQFLELFIETVNFVAEIPHGFYRFVGIFAFLFQFANPLGFCIALAFQFFHFSKKRAAFRIYRKNVFQTDCRVLFLGFCNVVVRIFTDFANVKHDVPR